MLHPVGVLANRLRTKTNTSFIQKTGGQWTGRWGQPKSVARDQPDRNTHTAIDDATRTRALKIYAKHNQANAIKSADFHMDQLPFRIHTIQRDNSHEFQAKFHWHCEDLGIRHIYIKPSTPRLNGKVERSHLTDKTAFHQLVEYPGDIDSIKKLKEWEVFITVIAHILLLRVKRR